MYKLSLCAVLAVGLFSSLSEAKQSGVVNANKPNVIYILADDLGYGDIKSFNPESRLNTKHIDRLASEGIRFTDMHTNSSVCTPTRYGLLTGRYAWRSPLKRGVVNGHDTALISDDTPTIGKFLQQHAYNTALVGKWHLGMDWSWKKGKKSSPDGRWVDFEKPIANGPVTRGFDTYFGISASLNMAPHVYIEQDRVINNELTFLADKKAIKKAGLVSAKPGWRDSQFIQSEVMGTLFDKSIEWIGQRAKEKSPFFLYLPLNAPHSPIVPIEPFKDKSKLSPHGDFTLEMDHHVGRLMAALKTFNIDDNTIVIFTADNGVSPMAKLAPMQAKGHYSSGLYRGLKGSLYEGGHRVPFIVRWPSVIKAGQVSDFHISITDFYATMADILGQPLSQNEAPDSVSFYPELRGERRNDLARGGVVYHSDAGFYSIRHGQWKLILHEGAGSRRNNPKDTPIKNPAEMQLFDMENDPAETVNLYQSHPKKVNELMALLSDLIKRGRTRQGQTMNNDAPYGSKPWVGIEALKLSRDDLNMTSQ